MDTVSPGDNTLWRSNPFDPKTVDGKIYGLGASDDKAGIAALLLLAQEYQKNPPLCDIFFTFVTNEELDGSGTKKFVEYFKKNHAKKYKNIAAIVCEATDAKYLEPGHRGDIKIRITTYGDSGHASRPEGIKTHAIEQTIKVIKKIKVFEMMAQKKYKDSVLGKPLFTLTAVGSNEKSINKLPNKCATCWDIRTTPGMHSQTIPLLKNLLGKNVKVEALFEPLSKPVYISKKEPIVNAFQNAYPDVNLCISTGSNDMCFFIEQGIPAVSFGHGTKSTIHKENEYVKINNIEKAVHVYKKTVSSFAQVQK
jgi:succinyl-diaminopimelate desuccinylase